MYLTLLLSFSLLLVSCGKHSQVSTSSQGVGNTVQVNELEMISQNIVDENLEGLQLYHSRGGDLEAELKNGRTPLTEACFWNKLKVISWLVHKKVDPEKRDRFGKNALDYAEEDLQIKRALFPHLVLEQKKALYLAARNNQLNEFKRILEENAPVNFHFLSAELGNEVLEDEGETLLTFCVKRKLENFVRTLAQPKYGLDVNQQNRAGFSALRKAREMNFTNIERLLIRLGAQE